MITFASVNLTSLSSFIAQLSPCILFHLLALSFSGAHLLTSPSSYATSILFPLLLQVLTRLLASSSPVIYWASAVCLLRSLTSLNATYLIQPNMFSLSEMIVGIVRTLCSAGKKGECVLTSKAILLYFLTYVLLGCTLHCNFYPWT